MSFKWEMPYRDLFERRPNSKLRRLHNLGNENKIYIDNINDLYKPMIDYKDRKLKLMFYATTFSE